MAIAFGAVRIDQHADRNNRGKEFVQQLQPLGIQFDGQSRVAAGHIAALPPNTGHQTDLDRVSNGGEDDRYHARGSFGGDPPTDQLVDGSQGVNLWQFSCRQRGTTTEA